MGLWSKPKAAMVTPGSKGPRPNVLTVRARVSDEATRSGLMKIPAEHFGPQSVVRTVQGHVWCDLGDEVAILHLGSGLYYGLNSVGARVWALLQEPRSVQDLAAAIQREYEVNQLRCETDLASFLSALAAAALIE